LLRKIVFEKGKTMHPNFPAQEVQAFISKTLDLWHVPGGAVAVVKDDETILCDGFGLREVKNNLPVTAETIFPIASCTKAFTAMCLALLVEEGKLEWDKPVRQYLPTFKLHDEVTSTHMTPRDLLCHRSGLPRHDFLWYGADFSRKEVFERLQYIEPSKDFRSTFQYQNMMFMVAGYLAGELTGMTWETFVQKRIFDVLGMSRSNTSTTLTQQDPDHGWPYLYRRGELNEIPFYEADERQATGPAGTIISCVRDMAHWLTIHLNGGKLGEQQFISPNQLEEMHKPHIFIDDTQARLRFGHEFISYGLGWALHSHNGQVLISHGGNIDGFSSLVSFMPRHNLGVVVLSNGDGENNAIPAVISYSIFDRLLGLESTDWNEKYLKYYEEMHAAGDRSKEKSAEERQNTPASHSFEDYLGDYEHPGYGIYSVRKEGEALQLAANNKLVMKLEHYHYDIFEADFERGDEHFKLSFTSDLRGNIAGFSIQIEPAVKEVFFKRLADRQLNDPSFLKQFTGQYELMGMLLSVELKEGNLFASLPGQELELEPYRKTEFSVKGMPGFSIAFQADDAGVYTQAVLTQPGAVFTAQRKI